MLDKKKNFTFWKKCWIVIGFCLLGSPFASLSAGIFLGKMSSLCDASEDNDSEAASLSHQELLSDADQKEVEETLLQNFTFTIHPLRERALYSSFTDSPFRSLPPELIQKIMDDREIYSILMATSYDFFRLGTAPCITRTLLIKTPKQWKDYFESTLALYQLPKIKITYKRAQLDFLTNFSETIFNLKTLDIGGLELGEKANFLAKLPNLQGLMIDRNKVGAHVTALRPLSHLTFLNINCNNIQGCVTVLKCLTLLTSLHVSSCFIEEHVTALAPLLSLTYLDVSKNFIQEHVTALACLTRLTSLNISCNFAAKYVASLTTLLALRSLDVSKNFVQEHITALISLKNLTAINISDNRINEHVTTLLQLPYLVSMTIEDRAKVLIPSLLLFQDKKCHVNFVQSEPLFQ